MHELAIAEGIIDAIEAKTDSKVNAVRLKIGEMSGVISHALEFAFDIASRGTSAEGAKLLIEIVPLTAKCDDCDAVFNIQDYCFECSNCKGVNFRIISGRELLIEEIETE